MIDLEKEREAFEDAYQHHSFIKDVYRAGNSYSVMPHLNIAKDKKKIIIDLANSSWNAWQRCSLRAQAEITTLKQKLEKIESGEFVLVPREPTLEMLKVADKHVMDCHATPESAYKVMIEASQQPINPIVNDGWISVEDKLPEIRQDVLVAGKCKTMIAHYDCCGWQCGVYEITGVTHWQPLPSPPQPTNPIDSFIASGGFDKAMGGKNGE